MTAVTLAAAVIVPSGAAADSPSPSPRREAQALGLRYVQLSNERTRTATAIVLRRSAVRAAPSDEADRVGTASSTTYLGSADSVLVLGIARGPDRTWAYVRYPGLGERTGWMHADRLGPRTIVKRRLVIDRARRRATLYEGRRVLMRAPIGIGAAGSPTPAGRAYVRERFVPRERNSVYGVLAFGLSAYSRQRTDWPGGGQVGVHGTNQPGIIPGRVSNGCIRLRNPDIRRLGRRLPIGTPVEIR